VHDPERQRDLVQETFTRALVKLDDLREPSRFRPWVFQIARRVAIDDLRERTRVTPQPMDDDDGPVSTDQGPDVTAEVRALAEAIRCGLAALSPRDAAAVSLVVHLGFGPHEVAAALDITPGNAKVVLHRARRRLRAALVQQDLLPGLDTESDTESDTASDTASDAVVEP
jgi:RNA polymerase sigma factor (sigma-70 family)